MDFVEINKFTREQHVCCSRDNLYKYTKIQKIDALRLIVYACKKMYGVRNTAKILHGIGDDHIDLSI